jgi:cysteine desulfurase/selenocysteine lyase
MLAGSSRRLESAGAKATYAGDFGPFDGRIWLNTAHQGAIPRAAAAAARSAVDQKTRPYLIRNEDFFTVPMRLRAALGRLINANPDDIILGNSATYGLDLLANGMRWKAGDEVLLVEGDYPANVYPWTILRDQGVTIRFLKPSAPAPQSRDLAREISARTRLFCASWVNPFAGAAIDVDAIGRTCRDRQVLFVLNASQALGARVLDVRASPVDAMTCSGSKWLCGPYGTGFCWMTPALRESLVLRHAYWLAMIAGRPLGELRDYSMRTDLGARAWDVFCPANFFNFIPWTVSIEYLVESGPATIAGYDEQLVSHLLASLDPDLFDVVSPRRIPQRSTVVIFRLKKSADVSAWFERLTREGFDLAADVNSLRVSPHFHNTFEEIDAFVAALSA